MRSLRIIFVSLLGVGVCGGVYLGLTVGLAAYMRHRASLLASPDTPTIPVGSAATAPAIDNATLAGPVGVEDAATLMRRQWTAPRRGLTSPPLLALTPAASKTRVLSAGIRTWLPISESRPATPTILPPVAVKGAANRFADLPKPGIIALASTDAPPPLAIELALGNTGVMLPVGPAAKVDAPDPDRIFLRSVGVIKNPDRPSVLTDPTHKADERQLLGMVAPIRSTVAPFEKLAIPDPTPNRLGDVMTVVPDADSPAIAPDRPVKIQLPTK